MPITDFQKKRYKLVPGQNYEDGPISRDGTFFNMMSRKMNERNKQLADSLPGAGDNVNDDFVVGLIDTINPVAAIGSVIRKYSVEEALKRLGKQKMTSAQVETYLKKNAPANQVEMAGIFGEQRSAADWLTRLKENGGHRLDVKSTGDGFEDITLPGANTGTYETMLTKFKNPNRIPRSDAVFTPGNHYGDDAYAAHTRSTSEYVDDKPLRLIGETQSDYAQAERQGKGIFETTLNKDLDKPIIRASKIRHKFIESMDKKYGENYNVGDMSEKDKITWGKLGKKQDDAIDLLGKQTKVKDALSRKQAEVDRISAGREGRQKLEDKNPSDPEGFNWSKEDKDAYADFSADIEDGERTIYQIQNTINDNLLKDLPIKPEVLRRDTIMTEMNNAMNEDYARVGIPIQRHGTSKSNPLAGTEEVTDAYLQNVPQDFRNIKNHMSKQGIDVTLGMPYNKGGDIAPSLWKPGVNEEKLYEVLGDYDSEMRNTAQFHRDQGNTPLADQFDELADISEDFQWEGETVLQYDEFKNRVKNSGMDAREAFQEMFEGIERGSGSADGKNVIYTMEFAKPKGREADHWRDIDVDWKVW